MNNEEIYVFTRLFWSDLAIFASYISLIVSIATLVIARGLKKSLRIKARLSDLYRSLESDREKLKATLISVPKNEINYSELDTIYSSLIGRLKATREYLPKALHHDVDSLLNEMKTVNNKDYDRYFNIYTSFTSLITQIEEVNKEKSWR